MAGSNENINIRERIEEELRRRGVNPDNLSDQGINNIINQRISAIGSQIERQIAGAVQAIDTRVHEKSRKQAQQNILDLLLSGKTPEEIHEDETFKEYSLLDIKSIEKRNRVRILGLKLVSPREISNIEGARVQTIYANLRNGTYRGKSITQIRREKEAEVIRRLREGQSVEDIAGDRELNVDIEAVKAIQVKQQRQKERAVVRIRHEDEDKILGLLLSGKTSEEISKLDQFKDYPIDSITRIEDRNRVRILAMQLMPLDEIAKRTAKRAVSIQQNIRKYYFDGKSILAIRKEKEEEVIKRLSEGQSIDNILEDKRLNVCREGIESIQMKQNSITWRQAVLEELLSGRTPEEISELEQFQGHTVEEIQRIANKNMLRIQAIQLVPEKELASTFGRKENSVRANLRNYKINGISISQIRREKEAEVERRLEEGQSIDDILEDKTLNVCREGIESIQARLENKKQKQRKNSDTRDLKGTDTPDAEREGQNPQPIEAHEKLEIMRKKYKEQFESQRENSITTRDGATTDSNKRTSGGTENISDEILQIITGIANGNLDVNSAKQIIADQSSKKVKGRKMLKFGLTEKQERDVLISGIRKVLTERGTEFPIKSPEITMQILQELTAEGITAGGLTSNLNVVVRNQLARRKFDEAEKLCEAYGIKQKDNIPNSAYIRGLKRLVRSAKVGDLVYRTINSEVSPEDEEKFWRLLQEGLKMGNVSMRDISLGKNKDGSKEITLEDIWPENMKERRK